MFASFTSTDGSAAVKTTAALAVICKLAAHLACDVSRRSPPWRNAPSRRPHPLTCPPGANSALTHPPTSIPAAFYTTAAGDRKTKRRHAREETARRAHRQEHRRCERSWGDPADYNHAGAPGEVEFLCLLRAASAQNFRAVCNLLCTRKAVAQVVPVPRMKTPRKIRL